MAAALSRKHCRSPDHSKTPSGRARAANMILSGIVVPIAVETLEWLRRMPA